MKQMNNILILGPKGLDGLDGAPGLPGPKGNTGGQGMYTFFINRKLFKIFLNKIVCNLI